MGCTPAHSAVLNGHADIAKLLIEVGQADVNIKTIVSHSN